MRRKHLLVTTASLSLLLSSCGKKADAVLIVKEDGVSTKGKVKVSFLPEGGYRPDAWVKGNIVIFRVDSTVAGESGKAGLVYVINDQNRLENIGKADLSKTDEELFAEFLKTG
jgi:hypothetical protein